MTEYNFATHRDIVAQEWTEKRQTKNGNCFNKSSDSICLKGRKLDLVQNDLSRLRGILNSREFLKGLKLSFNQKYGYLGEFFSMDADIDLLRAAVEF